MIHVYSMNNIHVAIDGNTGSIHVLDDISFDILKQMEQWEPLNQVLKKMNGIYKNDEIIEAYEEIRSLKEQGLLFTSSKNLENSIKGKEMTSGLKALCLHVSHDCNLRCEYCFASQGDYNSGRSIMSEEVALRAIDYLVENSGNRHNIEIDFFGGEPLMNFGVVKKAVAYGEEISRKKNKSFYFTITTNGLLLDDEIIDFINEHMNNVVISIDGRKEVHDSIRYNRNKQGTYDRIIPRALKLVSDRNDKSYFIRGTFTARNKDFSKDVMHLANMGFKEISIEPVVGSDGDLFITDKDISEILQEYEKFAQEYLDYVLNGRDFRFYHFNLNLYDGPCIFKRIASCGAGFEYLAVSPEGKLYPCHQFVGQDEFVMGDIYNGIENNEMVRKFKNNNILTKEKCKDCWAKLFCSGGCFANAFYSNGDIDEPNEIACTLQKKRIECAVMIQAAKHIKGDTK